MLDGLVGRAVLTDTDRVVTPDVDGGEPHQGGHPNRRPHVVAEDEEGADVGPGMTLEGDAVSDRAHRVLANTEVERSAVRVARPGGGLSVDRQSRRLTGHRRVVGAAQVG